MLNHIRESKIKHTLYKNSFKYAEIIECESNTTIRYFGFGTQYEASFKYGNLLSIFDCNKKICIKELEPEYHIHMKQIGFILKDLVTNRLIKLGLIYK